MSAINPAGLVKLAEELATKFPDAVPVFERLASAGLNLVMGGGSKESLADLQEAERAFNAAIAKRVVRRKR